KSPCRPAGRPAPQKDRHVCRRQWRQRRWPWPDHPFRRSRAAFSSSGTPFWVRKTSPSCHAITSGRHVPDVFRVFANRPIGREPTDARDVADRSCVPVRAVEPHFIHGPLHGSISIEISSDHEPITFIKTVHESAVAFRIARREYARRHGRNGLRELAGPFDDRPRLVAIAAALGHLFGL